MNQSPTNNQLLNQNYEPQSKNLELTKSFEHFEPLCVDMDESNRMPDAELTALIHQTNQKAQNQGNILNNDQPRGAQITTLKNRQVIPVQDLLKMKKKSKFYTQKCRPIQFFDGGKNPKTQSDKPSQTTNKSVEESQDGFESLENSEFSQYEDQFKINNPNLDGLFQALKNLKISKDSVEQSVNEDDENEFEDEENGKGKENEFEDDDEQEFEKSESDENLTQEPVVHHNTLHKETPQSHQSHQNCSESNQVEVKAWKPARLHYRTVKERKTSYDSGKNVIEYEIEEFYE